MSVDGTDVPILEPSPFHRRWFPNKINGPGMRYKMEVGINGGHIVWINGPLRPGVFNNVQIIRPDLHKEL